MPYSFTRIERERTKVIEMALLCLVAFYFFSFWFFIVIFRMFFYKWLWLEPQASLLGPIAVKFQIQFLNIWELLIVLGLAVLLAILHWIFTTRDQVEKILRTLRAKSISSEFVHQQFEHILGELSVATGGQNFQGYIIPTMAMNAFSISDLEGRQIIGVTEGLLYKLKRPQIEAVVAHEASHILKGDALDTTTVVSLFNLPTEILKDLNVGNDGELALITRFSIQGTFTYFVLCLMIFLNRTVGLLFNIFLARQREYRADAIAVRLTRNPLSFAEALFLMSHHWRGAGNMGEGLSSIFFLNPRVNPLEESQGWLADLFSTHPPVRQRLSVLLEIGHSNFESLTESLLGKNGKFYLEEFRKTRQSNSGENPRWVIFKEGNWEGPFTLDELKELECLYPNLLVKRVGEFFIMSAGEDTDLKKALAASLLSFEDKGQKRILCPCCYVLFSPLGYEGMIVLRCDRCGGVLVEEKDVDIILESREMPFPDFIKQMAQKNRQQKHMAREITEKGLFTDTFLACPKCQRFDKKMVREFFSDQYPVEVDRCPFCRNIWFDKNELEILQCLHEEDYAEGS